VPIAVVGEQCASNPREFGIDEDELRTNQEIRLWADRNDGVLAIANVRVSRTLSGWDHDRAIVGSVGISFNRQRAALL
jgi:hypothetical protein